MQGEEKCAQLILKYCQKCFRFLSTNVYNLVVLRSFWAFVPYGTTPDPALHLFSESVNKGNSWLTYQQKRWPLPQSTAGALSKEKLRESEAPGPGLVSRTALSHLAMGHQRMAGLLSTKAWWWKRNVFKLPLCFGWRKCPNIKKLF